MNLVTRGLQRIDIEFTSLQNCRETVMQSGTYGLNGFISVCNFRLSDIGKQALTG